MELDWEQVINWAISGLIGLIFGVIGGYIKYRFDRKRDELNWKKEREKLEIQYKHEKELLNQQWVHERKKADLQWEYEKEQMALQWANELKKLEFNYQREHANGLRSELLRGIDNPSQAIRAAIAADTMRVSHVIEKVPAGGFGIVGIDESIVSDVEVDRVIINGVLCRIVSLRPGRGRIVDLSKDDHIIMVTGDSMNEAGIDIGDYVLFHTHRGAEYNHNNIVVVKEIDIDIGATIKLLKHDHGYPMLVPMSSNREYNPIELTNKMQILGTVTAVFKPVGETKAS